jgi:hypothetical protein
MKSVVVATVVAASVAGFVGSSSAQSVQRQAHPQATAVQSTTADAPASTLAGSPAGVQAGQSGGPDAAMPMVSGITPTESGLVEGQRTTARSNQ